MAVKQHMGDSTPKDNPKQGDWKSIGELARKLVEKAAGK